MAGKEKTIIYDFFRFPHTPHLAWLGEGFPRDDKVLAPLEADAFLAGEVVVEEKLDGANMGISFSPEGDVQVQNRGQYLQLPMRGQFEKLHGWLQSRVDALFDALGEGLILFGEWCAARHSIGYERLPDWFVVFDVYDKEKQKFWSTAKRNNLAAQHDFPVVPRLLHGHISLMSLKELVQTHPSAFREGPLEGIVVRRESADWLDFRAKLVRPDFVQAIGEHWSHRRIEWNSLTEGDGDDGEKFSVISFDTETTMRKLDEKTMSKRESRIPQLAENAVKQARLKTLKAGRSVVEAVDGNLIESHPDGTFKVIRPLAAPISVVPGQKRVRKSK